MTSNVDRPTAVANALAAAVTDTFEEEERPGSDILKTKPPVLGIRTVAEEKAVRLALLEQKKSAENARNRERQRERQLERRRKEALTDAMTRVAEALSLCRRLFTLFQQPLPMLDARSEQSELEKILVNDQREHLSSSPPLYSACVRASVPETQLFQKRKLIFQKKEAFSVLSHAPRVTPRAFAAGPRCPR